MNRYGRIAYLRQGKETVYDKYHKKVWPAIIRVIKQLGVKTYSIFRHRRKLFSYMELHKGISLEEFTRLWMKNSICCRWEKIMQTLQQPVKNKKNMTYWIPMKEIFHTKNLRTNGKRRKMKK